MKDWIDAKGRLHRFLGVTDGRALFKVEVPSTVVRSGFDPLVGGDSATYYSSTDDRELSGDGATYSTARGAATGVYQLVEDWDECVVGQMEAGIEGDYFYVARAALFFDTSGLPDDASVTAAVLGLRGTSKMADRTFDIVAVVYTGSRPATVDDWDELGSTSYGSISSGDWVTNGYNSITLNSTGRAAISKTGWTYIGLRSSRDIDNDAPSGDEFVVLNTAYYTGTDRDPKLVVTYSVDVTLTPPSGWFTFGTGTPTASTIVLVQAPSGHLALWPGVPDVGVYVVVAPPSGLLTIGTTSPSIIAGTGVIFDAPSGHFTFWPKGGVHEAPHLPYPLKVSRTRPSHWFSSRRDIVRK